MPLLNYYLFTIHSFTIHYFLLLASKSLASSSRAHAVCFLWGFTRRMLAYATTHDKPWQLRSNCKKGLTENFSVLDKII